MLNKKEQQALAEKFRATFIQTSAYEMKIADLADDQPFKVLYKSKKSSNVLSILSAGWKEEVL
ncbi:hypothetical protein ABEP17_02345 [Priestia flexa]|uniref:hypothetical protein n=1 Tax=Priestia flexa TaxID=86664 RepID=UPI001F1B2724|nr:hypothetical protein [Priestia flexa]MCM3065249.1 hypothetical protein [Priestia flexa]MCP1191108.1 hypothetical protein [Priestia flexa]